MAAAPRAKAPAVAAPTARGGQFVLLSPSATPYVAVRFRAVRSNAESIRDRSLFVLARIRAPNVLCRLALCCVLYLIFVLLLVSLTRFRVFKSS